ERHFGGGSAQHRPIPAGRPRSADLRISGGWDPARHRDEPRGDGRRSQLYERDPGRAIQPVRTGSYLEYHGGCGGCFRGSRPHRHPLGEWCGDTDSALSDAAYLISKTTEAIAVMVCSPASMGVNAALPIIAMSAGAGAARK